MRCWIKHKGFIPNPCLSFGSTSAAKHIKRIWQLDFGSIHCPIRQLSGNFVRSKVRVWNCRPACFVRYLVQQVQSNSCRMPSVPTWEPLKLRGPPPAYKLKLVEPASRSIMNSIHVKQGDLITYPCPIFNGDLTKPVLKLGHGWVITST